MAKAPTKPSMTKEIGVSVDRNPSNQIRPDEFLSQLRGQRGIRRFREMRENDATVGAIMFTIEQMLRPVKWEFKPSSDSQEAVVAADIVNRSINSLEIPFTEFISDALSFFTYGFSTFEKVFHRDPATGHIMLSRLSPRPQWSIERMRTKPSGDLVSVEQSSYFKRVSIPAEKVVHFRTTPENQNPSGRSALRNAYVSYYRLSHLQEIEAIAIERELNGLPVGRIPSSFLGANATADQKNVRFEMEKILREIKKNEQGFMLLPSELQTDDEGKLSTKYLVDVQLLSSNGTRDIDVSKAIIRYQQDIARSVMADFVMLGANDRGSFAMSSSKSALFLKALHGFMDNIRGTLKTQLMPQWMEMNGLPASAAPNISYGVIQSINIDELGTYVQKLAMAGAPLFPDGPLEDHLRSEANLPSSSGEGMPVIDDGDTTPPDEEQEPQE